MIRMMIETILATVMVSSAFMVVSLTHPMRSIMAMMVCMITSAMLWLSFEAEFLALMLIIVHGGAIMTLFIYITMTFEESFVTNQTWLSSCTSLLLMAVLWCSLLCYLLQQSAHEVGLRGFSTHALGLVWVRDCPWSWLMLGVLLTIAMIGCVHIVYRSEEQEAKSQEPKDQVELKVEDRLHFSMKNTETMKPSINFDQDNDLGDRL